MFRCGICHVLSQYGEKAVRVVTATREATYPFRPNAHIYYTGHVKKVRDDPGGHGPQIVTEVLAHSTCAPPHSSPST